MAPWVPVIDDEDRKKTGDQQRRRGDNSKTLQQGFDRRPDAQRAQEHAITEQDRLQYKFASARIDNVVEIQLLLIILRKEKVGRFVAQYPLPPGNFFTCTK